MFTPSKIRNKKLLILGLISLSILSLVYLFFSSKNSNSPSYSVLPLPLQLSYIHPPAGKQETFWTTTAIEFKFNQEVNVNTLKYSVTPETEVIPSLNSTRDILYIRPTYRWESNIKYKIEISALTNFSGSPIPSEIVYEFEIVPPDAIFIDEPDDGPGLDAGI